MDKTKQIMQILDKWHRIRNMVSDALPQVSEGGLDKITNAIIETVVREILKEGE